MVIDLDRTYLKDFILKQKCLPWFVWEYLNKCKNFCRFIQCKFNLVRCKQYNYADRYLAKKALITFLIPHKNGAEFIKFCIESIQRNLKDKPYQIMVADDSSDPNEFDKLLELTADNVSLYRFAQTQGHGFILEWLFRRIQSTFVVILDQDSILLKSPENLLKEFELNHKLLIIGVRDQCVCRNSRDMVHPSFMMIHRERVCQALRGPLFVGYNIPYGSFK